MIFLVHFENKILINKKQSQQTFKLILDFCVHENLYEHILILYDEITLTQIPHPMHNSSEIDAILLFGVTSIQSFPILTTGQDRLHSCLHLLGLHLSELTMAMRVNLSVSSIDFLGGMMMRQANVA